MPILSAGRTNRFRAQRGVTLIEMLVVVAIIGLIVGVSAPSVSAGLDGVRLNTATQDVASFLNAAVNRAERREEPVELLIHTKESRLTILTSQPGFEKELKLPDGVTIESVQPQIPGTEPDADRRLLLLPGSTVPGLRIQLHNARGARRAVQLDPMTGFPQVESVNQ